MFVFSFVFFCVDCSYIWMFFVVLGGSAFFVFGCCIVVFGRFRVWGDLGDLAGSLVVARVYLFCSAALG